MVSDTYFILFKTADAEKRAWRNLHPARKNKVLPVVELTRGRKLRGKGKDENGDNLKAEQLITQKNIYGFEKNVSSTLELMMDCESFFIDLTRESSLSCYEIEELSSSKNGYENWVKFILDIYADYPSALPVLIVNPSDDDNEETYLDDLKNQLKVFKKSFRSIAYRASVIDDDEFLYDLLSLKDEIIDFQNGGGSFYLFLDHEYIRPNNGSVHAKRTSEIISSVLDELPLVKIVLMATSFPKNVVDIGEEDHDLFRLEEVYLYREVLKNHKKILYGDYASINPVRNDEVIITTGWRPRIDFVCYDKEMSFYYFREKRDIVGQKVVEIRGKFKKKNVYAPYSKHYVSVAKKVTGFYSYDKSLKLSWGDEQIRSASKGDVKSNSPSHWISVRMEVHIVQLLRYLGLDPLI